MRAVHLVHCGCGNSVPDCSFSASAAQHAGRQQAGIQSRCVAKLWLSPIRTSLEPASSQHARSCTCSHNAMYCTPIHQVQTATSRVAPQQGGKHLTINSNQDIISELASAVADVSVADSVGHNVHSLGNSVVVHRQGHDPSQAPSANGAGEAEEAAAADAAVGLNGSQHSSSSADSSPAEVGSAAAAASVGNVGNTGSQLGGHCHEAHHSASTVKPPRAVAAHQISQPEGSSSDSIGSVIDQNGSTPSCHTSVTVPHHDSRSNGGSAAAESESHLVHDAVHAASASTRSQPQLPASRRPEQAAAGLTPAASAGPQSPAVTEPAPPRKILKKPGRPAPPPPRPAVAPAEPAPPSPSPSSDTALAPAADRLAEDAANASHAPSVPLFSGLNPSLEHLSTTHQQPATTSSSSSSSRAAARPDPLDESSHRWSHIHIRSGRSQVGRCAATIIYCMRNRDVCCVTPVSDSDMWLTLTTLLCVRTLMMQNQSCMPVISLKLRSADSAGHGVNPSDGSLLSSSHGSNGRAADQSHARVPGIAPGALNVANNAVPGPRSTEAQARRLGQPRPYDPDPLAQRIPVSSSITFHVGRSLAGEVQTSNSLAASKSSSPQALARAVYSRVCKHQHTVVECVGPSAAAAALTAIALARVELLGCRNKDVAVVLDPRSIKGKQPRDAASVLQHRFIVLTCAKGRPWQLEAQADVTW